MRRGAGVVVHEASLDQPLRLRELRRLRDLYLIAQPPLLSRRGDRSPLGFVKYVIALLVRRAGMRHLLSNQKDMTVEFMTCRLI